MIQENAGVLSNIQVGPGYYKITFGVGEDFKKAFPGQFVMARVPNNEGAVLRRPFSIHRVVCGTNGIDLEILFKVVGKGTTALARVKAGDQVDILGPLGKGFTVPESLGRCFLVGGGIGIAPLIFLLDRLARKGVDKSGISLFIGAASKKHLLCLDEVRKKVSQLYTATDDGSFGEKGLVTRLLETALENIHPDIIYACGPIAMLKQVAFLGNRSHVPCQISLESMMACGMGACLGCAVKNTRHLEKYDHVCMDGPVFDLENFQF
jgi:dihydroorotate dehydrogenase electron transfer subunit